MDTETFSKQYPIALEAIAAHIRENHLPAPLSIESHLTNRQIVVVLAGYSTHPAWLSSVAIDAEDNEYRAPHAGTFEPYFRTTWDVRLPDTGLRVALRGSRPLPLSVVSA